MRDRRVPNERLKDHRKLRGWSQQDLVNELLAKGRQIGERNLGLTFKQVSRWEQGWAEPRPPYTKLLCLVFAVTAPELGLHSPLNGPDRSKADGPPATGWTDNGKDASLGLSDEEESTRRREFIKLTFAPAVAPEALRHVLHSAAGEAMEFTRLTEVSVLGPSVFDHLEAVLADVDRSYSLEAPSETFSVARAYRLRVEELILGRHTLKEARELYVYAGWLSETLAWLSHDLGAPPTAEAYAVDCYQHADQAGHNELCAWAMDAMASIALYDKRPEKALLAARKGMGRAPVNHPLAVRLRCQAARAHARLGRREECEASLAEARELYEALTSRAPTRFGVDTATLASYAMAAYPATAYIWLEDFAKARSSAEEAVAVHESAPAQSRSPSREAIARIDLGIALAELGVPDEAAAHGRLALASSRMVDSVRSRAADLDAVLMARYRDLPEVRDFHDQYRTTAGAAAG